MEPVLFVFDTFVFRQQILDSSTLHPESIRTSDLTTSPSTFDNPLVDFILVYGSDEESDAT